MTSQTLAALASAVLLVHLGVILFNLLGLIVIPIGAWLRWRFVRIAWWRLLHVGTWTVVAIQAILGRACFLTVWEADLLRGAGLSAATTPLVQRWVSALIYWPLPLWVFAVVYVSMCLCVAVLWWLVPPVVLGRAAAPSPSDPREGHGS